MPDKHDYYRMVRRKWIFTLLCAVAALFGLMFSLSLGFYDISFMDSYRVVIEHITGNITDYYEDDIIWGTRLPIGLFAIIVGAVLAIGGAVMQSLLRNPLADPYTMGVSSGALLGASIAIVLGESVLPAFGGQWAKVIMAFLFSLIPVAVILMFSFKGKVTPTKIILIGIAMMYIFSAATTLLMLLAPHAESVESAYTWTVGSLGRVRWDNIWIVIFT